MDSTQMNKALSTTAAAPVAPAGPALRPEEAAPGFQALLEKLEATAGSLAERKLDEPEHLAGAVADAKASLETALDLGRDLIEAYRQERLQDGRGAA